MPSDFLSPTGVQTLLQARGLGMQWDALHIRQPFHTLTVCTAKTLRHTSTTSSKRKMCANVRELPDFLPTSTILNTLFLNL
jgi:hypothetical protein